MHNLNSKPEEKDKKNPGRPPKAPVPGSPLPDPFTPLDPNKRPPAKPIPFPRIQPIPPIPST